MAAETRRALKASLTTVMPTLPLWLTHTLIHMPWNFLAIGTPSKCFLCSADEDDALAPGACRSRLMRTMHWLLRGGIAWMAFSGARAAEVKTHSLLTSPNGRIDV